MHTDYSVSDIAEKLNFKEPTHFNKFFKRETGCTPTEFRQQYLILYDRVSTNLAWLAGILFIFTWLN